MRLFLWGHLQSTVYETNPHTIQELKDDISHAVAAIDITILHLVYLNMIRRAQLCIDAGGNYFQHLL
jgi:predicted transcriptional regulator